jgi:hypothetical protein
MLFNIVADMLVITIERAKVEGYIEGVVSYRVDGDISILQYADDIILFIEHNLEKAINLNMILCSLKLSFMKVNCCLWWYKHCPSLSHI